MKPMDKTKLTAYINGKVTYDDDGQYLWINSPDGLNMLGEVRGWGHIQNMKEFKGDLKLACKFQDRVGQFVADAINEKIAAKNQVTAYKEELRKEIEEAIASRKRQLEGAGAYSNADMLILNYEGQLKALKIVLSLLDKPQNQ